MGEARRPRPTNGRSARLGWGAGGPGRGGTGRTPRPLPGSPAQWTLCAPLRSSRRRWRLLLCPAPRVRGPRGSRPREATDGGSTRSPHPGSASSPSNPWCSISEPRASCRPGSCVPRPSPCLTAQAATLTPLENKEPLPRAHGSGGGRVFCEPRGPAALRPRRAVGPGAKAPAWT